MARFCELEIEMFRNLKKKRGDPQDPDCFIVDCSEANNPKNIDYCLNWTFLATQKVQLALAGRLKTAGNWEWLQL